MQETLRTVVAELLQVSPDQISAHSPLVGGRLGESMGRALLDAALRRRLGTQCAAVYTVKNYGELEAAITGKTSDVPTVKRASSPITTLPTTDSAVGCGVDMQRISDLPTTDDYWEHEFYKTHFTKTEIGYCLLQSNPRIHFAGRWCAKEALKKCDPSFLAEDMGNIEVISDNSAPTLFHLNAAGRRSIPYALSITHTADAAVAVVIRAPVSKMSERLALPHQQAVDSFSTTPQRPSSRLMVCCIISWLLSGFAVWLALKK